MGAGVASDRMAPLFAKRSEYALSRVRWCHGAHQTHSGWPSGWHAAKVGVCARFEPKAPSPSAVPDEHRPSYASTDYCVGFEPEANFLPRLYAHALKRGSEDPSCRQVVLIGDGAH